MNKTDIIELLESNVTEDQFVVDVKIISGNNIKVFIDDFNGLSIEDCRKFSKLIQANYDRDIEDYSLEVSSPGIEKPFKVKKQYIKAIGNRVEVLSFDGEKFVAELNKVNENDIECIVEEKINKKIEKQIIKLEFKEIKKISLKLF